jgi:hypothetical protein
MLRDKDYNNLSATSPIGVLVQQGQLPCKYCLYLKVGFTALHPHPLLQTVVVKTLPLLAGCGQSPNKFSFHVKF